MNTPKRIAGFPWKTVLSGCCAIIVGIGLSRFAYTPIVPALINQGWFDYAQTGYLGAANFVGYLAGAMGVTWLVGLVQPRRLLRASLVCAAAAFFACAFPLSFGWYFCWRFLSGATGGAITVLAVSLVISTVDKRKRGLAGGIMFMGVGIGVLIAALVVPLLAKLDLRATWLCLGAAACLLVIAGWRGWGRRPGSAVERIMSAEIMDNETGWPMRGVIMVYLLMAVGFVPFMVFFADYIARGLGRGITAGSLNWALFGAGAMLGPVLAGRLGDWLGFKRTMLLATLSATLAMALIQVTDNLVVLGCVSMVVGGLVPGIAPVTVGRIHEMVDQDESAQRYFWSRATAAFALGQAAAGYFYSWIFALTEDHRLLFLLAAFVLAAAFSIDLAIGLRHRTTKRSTSPAARE